MTVSQVEMFQGTAASLAAEDPRLPDGFFALEKDTGVLKVGDGSSKYSDLVPIVLADIVGTVGGVRTALFESDSNSNGKYIRFANGTQICFAQRTMIYANTTTLSAAWTFPAAFISDPYGLGAVLNHADANGLATLAVSDVQGAKWHALSETSVTLLTTRISGAGSFDASDTIRVNTFVIGNWM